MVCNTPKQYSINDAVRNVSCGHFVAATLYARSEIKAIS
jgi:hypothetical protein